MKNNITLLKIIIVLIPIAVVSFIYKDKTDFQMEKNGDEKSKIIRVLDSNNILELNLEDYIIGVVAAEIPASFDIEALKAQAVASRSYALYKKQNNNGLYDITNDTNAQVYINEEKMKEKWGTDYLKYYNKIKEAVLATRNEVMTYKGDIIEAFYFAMSSGRTQDVSSVFNENKDYLVSVESIYDNNNLKNYEVIKTFSLEEFKRILNCQELTTYTITNYENGYVKNINICNKNYSGNEFRTMFQLRSANFKLELDSEVKITTYGYGHGVGLSQYGANGYAQNGYNYQDILKHYYKNVEITDIKNV